LWITFGAFAEGWVDWRSGRQEAGLLGMRRGDTLFQENGVGIFYPLVKTLLAEAEAAAGETGAALATIDQAIVEAGRMGQHWFDAEINRMRGEILLERYPTSIASSEESFLAAIAVAQQQKTRSFELRAALSLAKLYQVTQRNVDARALLGVALEGFSPTPEFPEIEQALALLAAIEAQAHL
jgi:predicted ATPase